MDYRTLGKTGLKVSVLGFGGAEIGYEGASDRDVEQIVNAAFDAGVNVFDTAECYVDSEEKLGRALAGRRKEVLLFTKCGHASGLDGPDWAPDMLRRSIDRSLERLRTTYVDLLQLHSCTREELERGDLIGVLREARDGGKTRYIGYSGDHDDALYALETGAFDTLQTSISIADQEAIDRTVPLARELGIGVIAKRPIANAAWKYESVPENAYHRPYWERLNELRYDFLSLPVRDAVSLALRFTVSVPGVHMAIAGTKNPARWAENSRILDEGELPQSAYQAIRSRWREGSRPDWIGLV